MKKLEDIPKKNIFEVPEGYFDRLPGVIQARVAKPEVTPWYWSPVVKFALPLVLVAVGLFWFVNRSNQSIEQQLAGIQTEQLIAYLEDSDLNVEELTESVTWSDSDLEELEEKVYSSFDIADEELDLLMQEFIETENF
jgi:hypothetical protein